jgi:hypothetical protein
MIDQQLIETNTQSLSKSLKNSKVADNYLRLVSDPFDKNLIAKFNRYIEQNYNSELWQADTDEHGVPRYAVPRFKISWDADTIIEELHEICQQQKPVLEEIYYKQFGDFVGIMIWRDHPGFEIGWHTDNPIIGASLQIYMGGSDNNPGTEFKVNDSNLVLPFVPNTGYLVDQSDNSRPRHRSAGTVAEGAIRYSLFAMWN